MAAPLSPPIVKAGVPSRMLRGFTLLEMLVVMALMALLTGMVLPRLASWMSSVQERGWRSDLHAYLEGMPVRAFLAGEEVRLDATMLLNAVPGAPSAIELRLPEDLIYGPTGAATGGRIEFLRGSVREVWLIEPVSGRVHEGA